MTVYKFLISFLNAILPSLVKLSGNKKLIQFFEVRRQQIIELGPKKGLRYWFHCASLGEFEQARPLMLALRETNNQVEIICTFFSESGYSQRKNDTAADSILYLPTDTRSNVKTFLDQVHPDRVIFIKNELWPNYLSEVFRRKIPAYLVSAVFREKHPVFKFYGGIYRSLLPGFQSIFVQDNTSEKLLVSLGLKNILRSGDTRFDRVLKLKNNTDAEPIITNFIGQSKSFILGSSWPEEEKMLNGFIRAHEELAYILAPHDVSEEHIQEIQAEPNWKNSSRVSRMKEVNKPGNALILDEIGHLANAYKFGTLALVGGGFGRGLHNILEPLAYGVPVIFGPEYHRYPEAVAAIEHGVAFSIRNETEFQQTAQSILDLDEASYKELKEKCRQFIVSNSGATQRIMENLA